MTDILEDFQISGQRNEWEDGQHEESLPLLANRQTKNPPISTEGLNSDQAEALHQMDNFISEPYKRDFLLEGPAGSGKTYTIQKLVRAMTDRRKKVLFTAPTNKALKILKRAASRMDLGNLTFMTTYRMLALTLKPDGMGGEKIVRSMEFDPCMSSYDLVVIDEGSMTKEELKRNIDSELQFSDRTKAIYMADRYQLPPVGEEASAVFSEVEDRYGLTVIERQRQGSPIAEAIDQVRRHVFENRMPLNKKNSYTENREEGIWWNSSTKCVESAIRRFKSEDYKNDPDDIRIIAWRRKTVAYLNHRVRIAIYGEDADEFIVGERIITKGSIIQGEKVVLPTSEELRILDLTIGDVRGFKVWFMEVCPLDDPEFTVTLTVLHRDEADRFNLLTEGMAKEAKNRSKEGHANAWNQFYEYKQMFHPVGYCYSLTTHNSQGSTFRNVMVCYKDILMNSNTLERHQCLYTAMSRASHRIMMSQ